MVNTPWNDPGVRATTLIDEDPDIVRPFMDADGGLRVLRVETVVTATPLARSAHLGFEHAHIVQLCRHPMSVAELAVALKAPIAVTREFIADLVAERLLDVHAQAVPGDRELLERVRDGVRAL